MPLFEEILRGSGAPDPRGPRGSCGDAGAGLFRADADRGREEPLLPGERTMQRIRI